jgi:hypothetical protein
VGLDNGSGNRWQGYSHQELYDMLHSGPGVAAAGATADRWSTMAGALSDIQQDINAGIAASGASWVGTAGDSARDAIGPLGEWAQQASGAADVMRISTELQGDLLSKARADMPAPVPIPTPAGPIPQLVTAQVDFEVAEAASQVAAQQAFQVMAQYEAGTTDNTSTLGEFGEPPVLRVDTSPITGVAARGRVRVTESIRRVPRGVSGGRGGVSAEESGVGSSPGTARTARTGRTARTSPTGSSESVAADAESSGASAAEPTAPRTSVKPGGSPATVSGEPESARTPFAAGESTSPSAASTTSTAPTAPSSATVEPGTADSVPGQTSNPAHDRSDRGGTSATPRFTTMVPSARRANRADEPEDQEHESKYLIEAEDIYGDRQSYSPPVIGESRPLR